MTKTKKWDRSLKTSKKQQGIPTPKQVPGIVKKDRLRNYITKLDKAVKRGHQFPITKLPLSWLVRQDRKGLRATKRRLAKGVVKLVDDIGLKGDILPRALLNEVIKEFKPETNDTEHTNGPEQSMEQPQSGGSPM